jgi:hypothetical protein
MGKRYCLKNLYKKNFYISFSSHQKERFLSDKQAFLIRCKQSAQYFCRLFFSHSIQHDA